MKTLFHGENDHVEFPFLFAFAKIEYNYFFLVRNVLCDSEGFLVITVPFTLHLHSLVAIEIADILYRENIHNSKFLTEVESDSSSKAAIARE